MRVSWIATLSVALLSTPALADPPKPVDLSQARKITVDPNALRAMPDWQQSQAKLEERIDAMQKQLTATQQQLSSTQAALTKAQNDMQLLGAMNQSLQTKLSTHTHKVTIEHVKYTNHNFVTDGRPITSAESKAPGSFIEGLVPTQQTTSPAQ
jgi:Skp family chaperone for outer membrane proteins